MPTPCTWISKRGTDHPFFVHAYAPKDSDIMALEIDENTVEMGVDEMRELHDAIAAALDAREDR